MGYQNGSVTGIGPAPQPVAQNVSGQYGITVSNTGTIPLTLGGPGVVAGAGPQLPVIATPFVVPSHEVIGDGNEDLYVVANSGTNGSLGWMAVV
jgi:hypothetical protein